MLSGILNVYKEPGYTSNDVVAKLRGILGQRKIGHAGTLDPAASGVLPVLLGTATRLSDEIMRHEKSYLASMLLGVTTDTQDLTGTVLSRWERALPEEDAVRQAVLSFKGGYEQLPPMYSAKQVNGKRLYELAREGKEVVRSKVFVKITDIRIRKMDLPRVWIEVDCSKGTYIRTLCHDIGALLGCGAAMDSLVRTRAGGFFLEDAIKLDEIEKLAANGRILERIVLPEELYLDHLRVRTPSPEAEKKLRNGNALTLGELFLPERGCVDLIRLCTADGTFLALYRFEPEKKRYVPYRMFL